MNNETFNLSLISATLYRENSWRQMRNSLLLHSPVFSFFLPPFLILFLQLRRQFYYYHTHFNVVVGSNSNKIISSSLSSVLPYASDCICCWIVCLPLVFINSFSFFFRIGTYCFKTTINKTTTERQFDLLLLQPLPWNPWCYS